MAASTVNIADFRCRASKSRSSNKPLRSAGKPFGLAVVQSEPVVVVEERQAEPMSEALVSENPAVFDIGKARQAQPRHRLLFRPIAVQRRRSNVIRFGEPGVAVMRAKGASPRQHWTAPASDYDLPPAA